MNIIKIIILGDSGVGKSRLCHNYINMGQDYISDVTIGVDYNYKSYYINGIHYNINIWDTAGQDKYKSIIRSYYRNNDSCIIVLNTVNLESYKNAQYWIDEINKNSITKNIYLIGNKIDLKHKIRQNIINEIIQNLIKINKNIKGYYEVSSLTGENVEQIFNYIIEESIINNNKSNGIFLNSDELYEIDLNSEKLNEINLNSEKLYELEYGLDNINISEKNKSNLKCCY
jgi:small GTP-binding protein